jgi:hypothetical protein
MGGAVWLDPSTSGTSVKSFAVSELSVFEGNTAAFSGGALYLREVHNLTISGGSVFLSNRAARSDSESGGGAVWAAAASAAVGNSTWRDNTAQGAAGGGALRLSGVSNLTLVGGSYVRNAVPAEAGEETVCGGAVSVALSADAIVAIGGGLAALDNSAGSGGFLGATAADGATLARFSLLGPCIISGNSADRSPETGGGRGGAVLLSRSGTLGSVIVGGGCAMTSNSARGSGGALHIDAGELQNVSVGKSKWQGNTAGWKGGAISLEASSRAVGTIEVRDACGTAALPFVLASPHLARAFTFCQNAAPIAYAAHLQVSGATFADNTAGTAPDDGGGALHIASGESAGVHLVRVLGGAAFHRNMAVAGCGGAIRVMAGGESRDANVTVELSGNASFVNNTARSECLCCCAAQPAAPGPLNSQPPAQTLRLGELRMQGSHRICE